MPRKVNVQQGAIGICPVASYLALRYLRPLFQGQPDITLFSEQELLRSRSEAQSAVFVIDMEWKSNSLSNYLRSVKSVLPEARVLVLGKELFPDELCGLMFLGIDGFVAYADLKRDELLSAVRTVAQGRPWIDPDALGMFVAQSRKPGDRARAHTLFMPGHKRVLTGRERLVLGLLERRLANKEISAALGISERTVKFHVTNILTKLGMRDRHSVAEFRPPPSDQSDPRHSTPDSKAGKST